MGFLCQLFYFFNVLNLHEVAVQLIQIHPFFGINFHINMIILL